SPSLSPYTTFFRSVRQLDDGRVLAPFARHLLVRLRDVDDPEDIGQALEAGAIDLPVIADQADRGALLPGDRPGLVAHLAHDIDHAANVTLRRAVAHHDQHTSMLTQESAARGGRRPPGRARPSPRNARAAAPVVHRSDIPSAATTVSPPQPCARSCPGTPARSSCG